MYLAGFYKSHLPHTHENYVKQLLETWLFVRLISHIAPPALASPSLEVIYMYPLPPTCKWVQNPHTGLSLLYACFICAQIVVTNVFLPWGFRHVFTGTLLSLNYCASYLAFCPAL